MIVAPLRFPMADRADSACIRIAEKQVQSCRETTWRFKLIYQADELSQCECSAVGSVGIGAQRRYYHRQKEKRGDDHRLLLRPEAARS